MAEYRKNFIFFYYFSETQTNRKQEEILIVEKLWIALILMIK